MSDLSNEFDRSIAALQAIQLVQHHYGSAVESGKLIEQIATMLEAQGSKSGTYGGVARNVAQAIAKAVLNRETLIETTSLVAGEKAAALEKVLHGLDENNARDVDLLKAGRGWLAQYPNR